MACLATDTVLSLIPVMDGFVNDVETDPRRGLHTREDDEMAAWNSVVGHHQGLTLAHRTFTKTFKKTSDEEVHELYRNGIVHGMLTNFNNVVVATKTWNRLFAVADWALSREKQAIPPEPKPSLRALFGQIAENQRTQRALDAWQPRTLTPDDPGFEELGILTEITGRKRSRIYRYEPYVSLFDDSSGASGFAGAAAVR
jgi:hypothetical protein